MPKQRRKVVPSFSMSKPAQSSVRRHFNWQVSRVAGSVSGVSSKAVQQSTRVSSVTVSATTEGCGGFGGGGGGGGDSSAATAAAAGRTWRGRSGR